MADSRADVLLALVTLSRPIEELHQELARFDWDLDPDLVLLRRRHVIEILRRYLGSSLSARDVENWADALEVREDVEFEGPSEVVNEAIHFLANPVLYGPLTAKSAREWVLRLQADGVDGEAASTAD